ncbi:MAG: dual specificity protein phosphatase family protein [Chloroflexi bacterium]|nr:dual specificity protein phosphatase family protein [Chloroflexota bacterium]
MLPRALAGCIAALLRTWRLPPLDLVWLTADLAVGAAPVAGRLEQVSRLGITALVDMRTADERALDRHWEIAALRSALRVLHLPVVDRTAPTLEELEAASAWVESELSSGGRVLVCCRAGVGRSVTLATAVLVRQGYRFPEAFRLVGTRRRVANPTDAQLAVLRAFAAQVAREVGQ